LFKYLRAAAFGLAVPAACAALALTGTASASVKPNATAACSTACDDFSSLQLGPGVLANAFIHGDTGAVPAKPGQKLNFRYGDNSAPNEDFTMNDVGEVRQFCRSSHNPDGILSSTSVACLDFRHNEAIELDWSPFSNESGYCAGTTGTPFNGKNVVLTACGTTEGSILIQQNGNVRSSSDNCDVTNGSDTGTDYSAYISGATTSFSHPFVVSTNLGTTNPPNQEQLQAENHVGSQVRSAELFCFQPGPFS
jgi:hypothetical protein